MTHNARHQRAPDSLCPFASLPKVRESLMMKSGDFPVEFAEDAGLKTRRLSFFFLGHSRLSMARSSVVCPGVCPLSQGTPRMRATPQATYSLHTYESKAAAFNAVAS